jgi:hypothetical protein
MSNDLTAGAIQSRILQYASLRYELKTTNHQQPKKLMAMNVIVPDPIKGTMKISIKEIYGRNNLFPPIADDNFFEVETYILDEVFTVAPRVNVINLDVKGAAPLILKGMQNILIQNPQVTIYMVFNSSHFDNNGVHPQDLIYDFLQRGFSVVKMNMNGKFSAISVSDLLNSGSVNLVFTKVVQSCSKKLHELAVPQSNLSKNYASIPNDDRLIAVEINSDNGDKVSKTINGNEFVVESNIPPSLDGEFIDKDRYVLALRVSGIVDTKALSQIQKIELNFKENELKNPENSETLENKKQYLYQPGVVEESFSESLEDIKQLGYKVVATAIDNASPEIVAKILKTASVSGIKFQDFAINIEEYNKYFEKAEYKTRYPNYYSGNLREKSLEHYLCISFLNLKAKDIFVDLASENSPIPEIYHRLTGATTFSQDIMYSPGINGNQIGGDACSMPVPDGFASKAALTCSIEHFEGDADTRLFIELSRVIEPGGMVFVCPFYIFTEAATQTDPKVSLTSQVKFDQGTTIYCAEGWGNRHARFYSPQSFKERIMNPVKDKFKFDFYYLINAPQVDPSVYLRFAFTATRL